MILLILGLVLFFALHLMRDIGMRDAVIAACPSENAYKGIYTVLALIGLGLIIWGKVNAAFTMVWQPIYELRYISHVLMIPAIVLVVAGNMPPSYIRVTLRNPMLLGVTFWGLAHLWSNGDMASMLLFGGFTLWAGFKFVKMGLAAPPDTRKASLWWDIIAVIVGFLLYVVVSLFHGQLFGVGLNFV